MVVNMSKDFFGSAEGLCNWKCHITSLSKGQKHPLQKLACRSTFFQTSPSQPGMSRDQWLAHQQTAAEDCQ